MDISDLHDLVSKPEDRALEFKRTTGELRGALQTVCAFLNTEGVRVLSGVSRDGRIEGQHVSDQTIHDITSRFDGFEPPAPVQVERVEVGPDREVICLAVDANKEAVPYTFEGRAYHRVGNTTRKMTQERYETLLLERAHARRRWENQPAVDVTLADLDHEEILRTREIAIQQRRISAGTSTDVGDILDRLGLRRNGVITQAAQALYGTRFLPDYPQCLLKMGRFRGTTITGDIIDNRQDHLHAFAMVREGMAFLDRTLPLSAHFREGQVFREDRLPIPPNAMREVLLNAVMHRDYSDPSGYVAVAIFDDRVEVRSVGRLPSGITVEALSGPHLSKPTNPLIADAFHRTGAVEIWGRGTNRVIDECVAHGIQAPSFDEQNGALVVTFRAAIGPSPEATPQAAPQVTPQVTPQVRAILHAARNSQSRGDLQQAVGLADREHFRKAYLEPLISCGWIEMTVPEKPNSPQQRYRTTVAGIKLLSE